MFLNYDDGSKEGHADAIVMWSGGSDSTLTLYEAKYILGLKVIAVKFELSFERQGMQQASKAFCEKHKIPLITVDVDLIAMFSLCHKGEQEVSEKTIVNFPWDKFSAFGNRSLVWRGGAIIAKQLGIKRIICGNNYVDFHLLKESPAPGTMGERFIRQNLKWLNPARILQVYADYLLINLPLALGYTKQKKCERLKEIDYQLTDSCYITTDSDCELGLLLPAASKKVYPQIINSPYASTYFEFLSGYITREQWLEEFIKANNFSPDDLQRAMKRMKELLVHSKLNHEIFIKLNKPCQEQFHAIDYDSAKKNTIIQLQHNQKVLISRYLTDMGKPQAAIEHAKAAVEICPNDKAGYQCLGAALEKNGNHLEALSVYRQGLAKFPHDFRLELGQALVYYALDQHDSDLEILKRLNRPNEKVSDDYKIDHLRYCCHKALGQTSETKAWLKKTQGAAERHFNGVIHQLFS